MNHTHEGDGVNCYELPIDELERKRRELTHGIRHLRHWQAKLKRERDLIDRAIEEAKQGELSLELTPQAEALLP
jgi:predicted TIM-barrel fold metal-dependent hydrolase